MSWSLHESLVILAAHLICGLHPEQVDSLTDQQLFGVPHGVWRQEAWPAEDPGVVDVEQAEDVCARVHNGEAGVVGAQNPVGAVGSNWEQKSQRQERRSWWLEYLTQIYSKFIYEINLCNGSGKTEAFTQD